MKKCQISVQGGDISLTQWCTVLSDYDPELLLREFTELRVT